MDNEIYSDWDDSVWLDVAGEEVLCTVVCQIGEQHFTTFKDFAIYAQSDYVGQIGQLYAYFTTKKAFNRHWQKVTDLKLPINIIIEETNTSMITGVYLKQTT